MSQRAKAEKKSARDLKTLGIILENLVEGLGSRGERCWSYEST